MGVFILALAVLAAGVIIGYWYSSRVNNRMTSTMISEINLLKSFNKHWGTEASNKYQLLENVSRQRSHDLENLCINAIRILETIKREQGQSLGQQQQESINNILKQARSIATP